MTRNRVALIVAVVLSCAAAGVIGWRVTTGKEPSARLAQETAAFPRANDPQSIEPHTVPTAGAPLKMDAANFNSLVAAANNDPKTAYALATALTECRRSALTYDAVSDINESGHPDIAARMMERAEHTQAACAGLTQQQLDQYRSLIKLAAERGNIDALVNYSDMLADTIVSPTSIANPDEIERYKRKSIEYLSEAADLGDRRALMKLSTAYEDGILARKDRGLAYKYAYAYALSTPNGHANKWVQYLEKGMSAKEIEIAQKLGNEYAIKCCR